MTGIAGVWNLDGPGLESPLGRGPLIFDGRLDNRDELLAQLRERALNASSSDSALILEAFRRWGCDGLCRLNGEFALAIFDSDRRQLILARDPVGCRPLYYWTNGKTFVFGSQIKTVLAHPDVPCRPNEDLIADYFVRGRLSYEDFGETFFQDVHAVLPGQRLTVASGSLTSTRFWDFDPESVVRFASYSDYAERLRELLFQAVGCRLRTAHPVAIAVSGGLDSSIVLCIAGQLQKDGATTVPLLPISLTASGDGASANASSLALLESTTQLRIERLPFGAPGEAADLGNAARHSEWPRFDDGWCAHRPMFTWAHAQGARTLLSGHWSDQFSFVTGYLSDLFTMFKWREIAAHLDEYGRWFVDADPRYFRARFQRELLFNLTSPRLRHWLRPFVRTARIANRDHLITAGVAARIERHRSRLARPRCRSAHARDIYQAVRSKAHRLQFEADAKLAASCGVELTTPFLDRDVIAYLMGVPGEIQNRGGVPRALLRDAMRGIVPEVILQRRWRSEDETVRAREPGYLSTTRTLDAAHTMGFLQQPFRVERKTLDFIGLEFWSRVFFSDRLTALQHQRRGTGEAMDKADPTPTNKDEHGHEKLPYSPPKLTVHGDLRTITAAKQSDRSEAGQPKTFNSGMP
ncbi:MAG: asparagine synthetase B family protein [Vicinamibacterales bacterium]